VPGALAVPSVMLARLPAGPRGPARGPAVIYRKPKSANHERIFGYSRSYIARRIYHWDSVVFCAATVTDRPCWVTEKLLT
jgi:hypothetical protein